MRLFYILLFLTSISLFACKKDRNSSNSLNLDDTLTTGWTKQVVSSGTNFGDIVFSNNQIGFVAGAKTYKTNDGGITWSKVSSLIWQTGNIAITSDNKFYEILVNALIRTTDYGKTFTSPIDGLSGIQDVIFLDNNNGFCIVSGSGNRLYKTTDGGATWKQITPLTGLSKTNSNIIPYATACFTSLSSGIISISDSIFKSTTDLNIWTPSKITGVTTKSVISLYATSSSVIYAGSSDGQIFQSIDGGTSFNLKSTFPRKNSSEYFYLDLHFIDLNIGYACFGNRIYKTTDGGSNWLPVVTLANSNIVEIHFTDGNHGWGCTNNGEVLRYSL